MRIFKGQIRDNPRIQNSTPFYRWIPPRLLHLSAGFFISCQQRDDTGGRVIGHTLLWNQYLKPEITADSFVCRIPVPAGSGHFHLPFVLVIESLFLCSFVVRALANVHFCTLGAGSTSWIGVLVCMESQIATPCVLKTEGSWFPWPLFKSEQNWAFHKLSCFLCYVCAHFVLMPCRKGALFQGVLAIYENPLIFERLARV